MTLKAFALISAFFFVAGPALAAKICFEDGQCIEDPSLTGDPSAPKPQQAAPKARPSSGVIDHDSIIKFPNNSSKVNVEILPNGTPRIIDDTSGSNAGSNYSTMPIPVSTQAPVTTAGGRRMLSEGCRNGSSNRNACVIEEVCNVRVNAARCQSAQQTLSRLQDEAKRKAQENKPNDQAKNQQPPGGGPPPGGGQPQGGQGDKGQGGDQGDQAGKDDQNKQPNRQPASAPQCEKGSPDDQVKDKESKAKGKEAAEGAGTETAGAGSESGGESCDEETKKAIEGCVGKAHELKNKHQCSSSNPELQSCNSRVQGQMQSAGAGGANQAAQAALKGSSAASLCAKGFAEKMSPHMLGAQSHCEKLTEEKIKACFGEKQEKKQAIEQAKGIVGQCAGDIEKACQQAGANQEAAADANDNSGKNAGAGGGGMPQLPLDQLMKKKDKEAEQEAEAQLAGNELCSNGFSDTEACGTAIFEGYINPNAPPTAIPSSYEN